MSRVMLFGLCVYFLGHQPLSIGAPSCTDLSHRQIIGGGVIFRKLIGCEKFEETYKTEDDEIIWVNVKLLPLLWDTTLVDDQHEQFESKNRWSWSTGNDVLSHDQVIEGHNKDKKNKFFKTMIRVFKKVDGKIELKTFQIERNESAEGKVTQNHKEATELLDPI